MFLGFDPLNNSSSSSSSSCGCRFLSNFLYGDLKFDVGFQFHTQMKLVLMAK